jgi:hypothetical protein
VDELIDCTIGNEESMFTEIGLDRIGIDAKEWAEYFRMGNEMSAIWPRSNRDSRDFLEILFDQLKCMQDLDWAFYPGQEEGLPFMKK